MTEPNPEPMLLHAFVDGELSPEERAKVLEWIAADSNAAAEYAQLQRLKALLGSVQTADAEPHVWTSCVGRLNEIDRNRRTERFVSKYAWGLCSTVALLILAGGLATRMGGPKLLGTSDVTRMASSLTPFAGVERPASSAVGAWLTNKLGSAPVENFGLVRILRAQVGEFEGVKMARLALRDTAGDMVLLVIPSQSEVQGMSPMAVDSPLSSGRIADLNCVTWHQKGYAMVLAGSRSADSLAKVALTVGIR